MNFAGKPNLSSSAGTAGSPAGNSFPLMAPGGARPRVIAGGPAHVVYLNAETRITPQARRYAVAELARRAGVGPEFFRSCHVVVTAEKTILEISNGVRKQVSFPHASPEALQQIASGQFRWTRVPLVGPVRSSDGYSLSDCVVPFVGGKAEPNGPIFYPVGHNHVECAFDLPLATLLTLSRWEESLDGPRDIHNRFPARQSVAWAGRFLDRPIVDEYGLAFEQALEFLFPSWKKTERKLRIKVSHDADHIGIPFHWKNIARHTTHYRAPLNSVRELMGWVSGGAPAELRSIRDLALLSQHNGLCSAVYWKASPRGARDSGYDPRHQQVRRVVEWLHEMGMESGVHPGYSTFHSSERLRREVSLIRRVLGDKPLGGRQHYLRWSPTSWIDWENCGLAYDSSVGFSERIGFRAGTCIPYKPWLFLLNRPADLLEIPLLVMDRTLLGYMRLEKDQAVQAAREVLAKCSAVGGVFTILWHNNSFLEPLYRDVYLRILEMCAGATNYDWQSDAATGAGASPWA